jgi:hypothetical protein
MYENSLNWQTWLKNGYQYMKAATPEGKKSRFGTDIRYNLLAMSMEGYILAILDFHGTLPDNHTFIDLITALELIMPLDRNLKGRILKYEGLQTICAIDKYSRTNPSEEDINDLREAVKEIGIMAREKCSLPDETEKSN